MYLQSVGVSRPSMLPLVYNPQLLLVLRHDTKNLILNITCTANRYVTDQSGIKDYFFVSFPPPGCSVTSHDH